MTKTKKHHWLFWLWIKIRGLLALTIVLAGMVVGLLSLLLPFESLYQDRLEQFLAQQWGLQVEVEQISGSWRGYGPYFQLSNLQLTGQQSVQLESADLAINVYQWLIPGGRTGIDLSINKAELDMIRSDRGASITINDDKDEARFTEMLDRVLTTGALRVDEMTLNLADESGQVLLAGLKADLLLEQDQTHRALQLLIQNEDKNQGIELMSRGLRRDSLTRDAQWYIRFDQFDLGNFKELVTNLGALQGQLEGQLDGELWLTAKAGVIQSITGQIQWQNPVDAFSFLISLKHQGEQKQWLSTIHVHDISYQNSELNDFSIHLQRDADINQIKSSDIPVAWLYQLASDLQLGAVAERLETQHVSGQIESFELQMSQTDERLNVGSLQFSEVGMVSDGAQFSGLSGAFEFNVESGRLLIDSAAGELSMPEVFRGEAQWSGLSAQVDLDWSGAAPTAQINNLWCACGDFNLQAWADVKKYDTTHLILTSQVTEVDVVSLWKYWPHRVWKPKTLQWLDEGLLGGAVSKGYVFVQGELVPKAFKSGRANFISRAYTDGVDNKFHPEWPLVNDIDSVAVFNHDSVYVDLISATTMGIQVGQAQVEIESFDRGVLSVDMSAASQDNQILDYIKRSPLVKNIELDEFIQVGGQQDIDLAFDVSIKPGQARPFSPQGTVLFKEGQFNTEHFAIDQINGPVRLDGYQLIMQALPAQLKSAAVMLNGSILTKSPAGVVIDVNLTGPLDADYLLNWIQQDLPIEGESEWNIHISNAQNELLMTADSSLAGVAIDLPAPLKKSAEENRSLSITCEIPCQETAVSINFNDEIKSVITQQAGSYHLEQLQFMDAAEPEMINSQLFGGRLTQLNLDEWLNLLAQQGVLSNGDKAGQPEFPVNEVDLFIDELVFMSRTFSDMALNIKRQANSYHIQVDSEAIKGLVVIDDDVKQKGIVAEFDHLNWVDADENADIQEVEQTTAQIPDIHLWAGDFSYAGVPLGALRMEMRNVADGIKVDQLSIRSELAEINVSGSWNKADGDVGRSDFNVVMFSEKIADFLQTVGFKAPITNAQTLIEMKANWAGVPSQFNIATMDGDLTIKIGQGQVLDQDPGFGRVLGLFNLTNLPRRLILDFRDVLADGLLFSSMEGQFTISGGVANTKDFLIKASSAKIHIEGDVGFADQSYAQTITIRPQIGKTFPTIGAIAGGPVGAAAGFLVQGLFDKQLKNRNEIIYQVTGTWSEPTIELISDE